MGSVSPRPIMLKSPASSPGSEAATKISPQESTPRPITKLSISRNYKIPPRPKPGRKPNTDIPPSRRKAQNREAQRAFRERKSFAVRQLEDQLAKQQQAFEMQQSQMKQQIALLQRQQNMQMKYSPHSPQSPQSPQTPPSPASPPNLQPLLAAASANESNHRTGGNGSNAGSGSSGGRRNSPGSPGPAIVGSPNSAQQLNVPQMVVAGGSPGSSPAPYGSGSYSYGFSPKSPGSPFGTPMTPSDYVSLELLDHVLDQKLPTGDSPGASGSGSNGGSNGGGHHRRRSSLLSISNITTSGGTGGSGSGNDTRSSSTSSASQSSGSTPKARRNSVLRIDPPNTTTPLELVNTKWSQPAVPLRRNSQRLEIDFTAAFTPREPRPLQVRSPPAPTDRCGFCTDTSSCICAATAAREEGISAELAPDLGTLGSPGDSFLFGSPNGSTTTNSTTTTATTTPASPASSAPGQGECTGNPGSCSQCRQDPMLTLFCSAVSSKPPSVSISPYSTYIPAQAAYKTLSRHPRFGFADLGMIVEVLQVKSSQVEVNSVAKALRILDTR